MVSCGANTTESGYSVEECFEVGNHLNHLCVQNNETLNLEILFGDTICEENNNILSVQNNEASNFETLCGETVSEENNVCK